MKNSKIINYYYYIFQLNRIEQIYNIVTCICSIKFEFKFDMMSHHLIAQIRIYFNEITD